VSHLTTSAAVFRPPTDADNGSKRIWPRRGQRGNRQCSRRNAADVKFGFRPREAGDVSFVST
jgi:hypothetical protein